VTDPDVITTRTEGDAGLGRHALPLAAICLAFFVVMLDTTIVNVALPSIRADLGGGVALQQWVVDAYTLVFAAFLLSGGAASDRVRGPPGPGGRAVRLRPVLGRLRARPGR
jgi:DHA2 family methylenomycin A resistance protein-like MFS transporter